MVSTYFIEILIYYYLMQLRVLYIYTSQKEELELDVL